MANIADLKLIQIPEFPKTDTLVGSGPEYVVLTKSDGVTYGMLTEDFKAFLGVDALMQMGGAITPESTLPAEGDYFWPATEPGVYANAGGVVVPENSLALISRVDGVYSISVSEIEPQDLSDYVTQVEFETVEPLVQMIEPSDNLVNNEALVFGRWNRDGTIDHTIQYILRTPLIPIDPTKPGQQQLTYGGGTAVSSTVARFVYFDAAGVFISFDYTANNPSTIPLAARFVGINLAQNTTSMGTDPQNTPYKNTAMVNYGPVLLPWVPFEYTIKPENIKGLNIADINSALQDSAEAVDVSDAALSAANSALQSATDSLAQAKNYTDTKIIGTGQIQDLAVTLGKLSQSVKDFITASGGGTVTNLADDEDLTSETGVLKLKDGADGYARIRVQPTPALQRTEIVNKANQYGYIIIQDILDFGSTVATPFSLVIPDWITVKFVGDGMIKNTRLYGLFKIEAGRKQIFENVQMWRVGSIGGMLYLNQDATKLVIPTTYTTDLYDWKNRIIIESGTQVEVDHYQVKPFNKKLANFTSPTQVSGNWRLVEGGTTLIRFEKNGLNQIYLFQSDQYVFVDKATNSVLSAGVWVDPATIKVGVVVNYYYNTSYSLCRIETTYYYPEWWGAKAVEGFDNKKALNLALEAIFHMGGGKLAFSSGKRYDSHGGIIARNNVSIEMNLAGFFVLPNTDDHLFIQDKFSELNSFDLNNALAFGNYANQVKPINGFFFDWQFGETLEVQQKYTKLHGYNWNRSVFKKVYFDYFSGTGIWTSIPGDVSIFYSRFTFNQVDGIVWIKEHLRLYECMSRSNGRYGLYTEGLHFKIMGGTYAHNGVKNMYIKDANTFVIVAPSLVNCTDHGIHLENCDIFTITGIHVQNSGKAGIFIDAASKNGRVTGAITHTNNTAGGGFQNIQNESATTIVLNSYE